ncbi:MAG: hypothetical protein M0Q94_07510, partial [Candidatus Cloacimonetes bacterium]|nr:hypothetical protein [Candidatus Cloacimonadota bacterium]
VLCVFDLEGNIITSEPYDVIQTFKHVPSHNFKDYNPNRIELDKIFDMYQQLAPILKKDYADLNRNIIVKNKKRLENWSQNRKEQYANDSQDIRDEIESLKYQKEISKYFQEKIEIQKKIDKRIDTLLKRDHSMFDAKTKIDEEFRKQHEKFIEQFDVDGIINPNLVIKF